METDERIIAGPPKACVVFSPSHSNLHYLFSFTASSFLILYIYIPGRHIFVWWIWSSFPLTQYCFSLPTKSSRSCLFHDDYPQVFLFAFAFLRISPSSCCFFFQCGNRELSRSAPNLQKEVVYKKCSFPPVALIVLFHCERKSTWDGLQNCRGIRSGIYLCKTS